VPSLRQTRVEQGLCVKCGNGRGDDGTKDLCRPCANARAKVNGQKLADIKRRRRKKGQCVVCGKPIPKPKRGKKRARLCQTHKMLQAYYDRQRTDRSR
jgi:hypothetical protein